MKRPNHKVMLDGQAQTWIGVNFWSRTGGPLMWRNYDPAVIDEELDIMKVNGMTLTRSFFYWPDFQPTPDTLDESLVAKFRDFLDRHHARGMTSIPTFIVGHMSGHNWDPAWRNERDLFNDVWMVGRQAWYVRELVARLHDHPAIAGWLLTNEVPIYGDWMSRGNGVLEPEAVLSWSQILIDAVRAGGGTQPVSIGEGAWGVEITGSDNGFRVKEIAKQVDFLGPHVYRMETDQVRQHLGAAFVCDLLNFNDQPVIMEEFGLTSDYTSDENAAHYYRQTLHHTLLAGATGWMAWNNTDYDDLYMQAPYTHRPFELHFGLIDKDGIAKPQALEMRDFAAVVERVDLKHLSRPDSGIAMVVPSWLDNQYPFSSVADAQAIVANLRQAYVAARHADLPVVMVRESAGLLWEPASTVEHAHGVAKHSTMYGRSPVSREDGVVDLAPGELEPTALGAGLPTDASLYLVPSTKALTSPTWFQLRDLAAAGATVYASFFMGEHDNQRGPWWPRLDELFGVHKTLRYGLVDRIRGKKAVFTFEQDFGDITAGSTLTFAVHGTRNSKAFLPVEPRGAEVIARDAHGNPALLRYAVGAHGGSMVLCTYPLEHMAAQTMEVNPEDTWRLYAALAAVAGVTPEVRVASGDVVCGEMVHDDGRLFTWLINMTDAQVTASPILASGELVDDAGVPVGDVTLPPFGVQVLERR